MRSLFKGYVSDAVIAELMESQDGVVLSGERRRIAVLFADIKGFTTISETASPERVVQLLNEYFGVMVGIIHSRGGTVNSLMGDGIMAIFGAPVIDGDAALHAVFAGQEMMRALAGVNESLQAKNYDPIGIGVGINSGEAVIGNMGSTQKMEYTAIGDVVNTAARIEGQTRKLDADILISEDAYRWIDGRVEATFIQDAELKGKGQTVRLYRVLWR
jgi:adenylate cyclase